MSQPYGQPYNQEPGSFDPAAQPGSAGNGYPPPADPGTPGYPPPGAPGTGYPPPANQGFGGPPPADQGFGPAPVPPKKRSVGKIIALVVAIVVVLCLGGIGIALFANRDKIADVAAATQIKVVEPAALGSRPKTTDPTLSSALDGASAEMKKEAGVTGTAAAFYGDAKTLDMVMVVAASSIGGSAQDRYDAMVKGLGSDFTVTNLKDVEPGPLGGIAKCGDGSTSGVPLGVCMWADSGSFAMLVQFKKTGADLQKDFVSYRGQIEQKS
jgi:hypothetical protein